MPRKSFPIKLYQMLEYIETNANAASNEQYNSIIAWKDHGRAFRIHDKKRLEEELLPLFFGTAKYQSFRRSLNNWNFRMISGVDNPYRGCYYHHQFLRRTQSALCARIKRVVISSNSGESDKSFGSGCDLPIEEPQFHTMKRMPSYCSSLKVSSSSPSMTDSFSPLGNGQDTLTITSTTRPTSASTSTEEVSKGDEKRGNNMLPSIESDSLWLKKRDKQQMLLDSEVLGFLLSFIMPHPTATRSVVKDPTLPVFSTLTTNLPSKYTSTLATVKDGELFPYHNADNVDDDMHIDIDLHALEELPEDPRELCKVFD